MAIKELHDLMCQNHEQVMSYFNKLQKDMAVGTVREGKIKVAHHDPASGKQTGTGWKMVTAGMILGPDGHAVSSKRPNST